MKYLIGAILMCLSLSMVAQAPKKEKKPEFYKKGEQMFSVNSLSWTFTNKVTNASGEVIGGGLYLNTQISGSIFLRDKWSVGLRLGQERDLRALSSNASIFSRYYLMTEGSLAFFVEAEAGVNTALSRPLVDRGLQMFANVGGGMAWRPGDGRLSMELTFKRNMFTSNGALTPRRGLTPGVGVNFHF